MQISRFGGRRRWAPSQHPDEDKTNISLKGGKEKKALELHISFYSMLL